MVRRLLPALAAFALAFGVGACADRSGPPTPPPAPLEPAEPAPDPDAFSGERAFAHLTRLVEIGPRVSGSDGAARARSYIRGQLEELGLEVVESPKRLDRTGSGEEVEFVNVVGLLRGGSDDVFVLAAPYDSRAFDSFDFVGANQGASGAALLLEMARVLSRRPLHYTVAFVFLDGEAPPLGEDDPRLGLTGTSILVSDIEDSGGLDRIRVAVYFDRVADRDLTISRDLRSNRRYREIFFAAARRLGHEDAFPSDAPFDSPVTGHVGMWQAGMRRVVVIADDRSGGDESPGTWAGTEEDDLEHCAPESLQVVGEVSLAGLRDLDALLLKLDRFAARPLEVTSEAEAEAGSRHWWIDEPPEEGTDPGPQSEEAAPDAGAGEAGPAAETQPTAPGEGPTGSTQAPDLPKREEAGGAQPDAGSP